MAISRELSNELYSLTSNISLKIMQVKDSTSIAGLLQQDNLLEHFVLHYLGSFPECLVLYSETSERGIVPVLLA